MLLKTNDRYALFSVHETANKVKIDMSRENLKFMSESIQSLSDYVNDTLFETHPLLMMVSPRKRAIFVC